MVSTPAERGEFPDPSDQHQVFVKTDYQVSQANGLTFRVNEDRFDSENSGVGGRSTVGFGSTSFYRNHDFYSALTSVLGSATLNELRVQDSRRPGGSIPNTPNAPQLELRELQSGQVVRQSSGHNRVAIPDRGQLFVAPRGLWWRAQHQGRIDFSRAVLEGFFCNFCDGAFTFPRDTYDPNDRSTYPRCILSGWDPAIS